MLLVFFKRSIIKNIEVDNPGLIKKLSFHTSFLNAIILNEISLPKVI